MTIGHVPLAWGALINGRRVYRCHAAQSAVLRSKARFTGAIAGTGGGKTACGPLFVMMQLDRVMAEVRAGKRDLTQDPILGMVVAPTHQIKERATAPTLVRMLRGTQWQGRYVPSILRYELPGVRLPTGEWLESAGTIWILSADNPDGLEGGQFDFVWADEAGQFKYGAMVAIEGRTGLRQAPVLITTTPYGMNWLKYRFFDRAKAGDPNYFVVQWSSKDNPAYPEEEYLRAKAGMSASRAAQRYDAQFARMSGLVYPDLSSCKTPHEDCLKRFNLRGTTDGGPGRGGIDYGWQDPFCGLGAVLTPDNHLWVAYERYKSKTPIAEHAAALPSGILWHDDPSRPDHRRELRAAGHFVRPANNDIELGIDAVSARIYDGTLHISDRCSALWAESEEYRFPEKDDEIVSSKPVDEFNHAMDTLRYLVMGVDRSRMASNKRQKDQEQEQEQNARDGMIEEAVREAVEETNESNESNEILGGIR